MNEEKKKKWTVSRILIILFGSAFFVFLIYLIFSVHTELKAEKQLIAMRDYILDTGKIDNQIKSKGEYAKIEKVMKDYYQEYLDYYDLLNEHDYLAVYDIITTLLIYRTSDLSRLLKGLPTYLENANEGMDGMIQLLEAEEIELLFFYADIDPYYFDFYKELMILDTDQEILIAWQNYKEENTEKMEYVEAMLEILVQNPEQWYVDDDFLYIIDDDLLEQYNSYYVLTFEDRDVTEKVEI